ncbi:MAG: hypothetical protein WBV39_06520 [Rudaea sp.]
MRVAREGSEYALTRLHARYALLMLPDQWSQLERIENFAAFVQQARDTVLRPWLVHFDPHVDAHRIEATLRELFRQRVAQVARWIPRQERAAIQWVEQAILLPVRRHRSSGGEAYPWLAPTPVADEIPVETDGAALVRAWLAGWRRLWPARMENRERRSLERLIAVCQATQRGLRDEAFRDAGGTVSVELDLRRMFRRADGSLAGASAYLVLLWLQTVRLRGALLRRRLFAIRKVRTA